MTDADGIRRLDPIRVLLLEDNPDDAELVLRALRRGGVAAEARRVDDEAGFLAGLGRDPDVVLADYNVPGFGAMDALGTIASQGLDIPVVVVSGAIGEDVAVATMKAGATDYVLKDRLGRLAQAVEHALEARRLRAAARDAERHLRAAKEAAEAARDEAEEARRQADSANRWKSAFLSMVGHDVRTPMTAISGYVELVREGTLGPLTPEQVDALGSVAAASERLLALLDDVLDYSRLEANRLELAPEPVDARELLEAVRWEFAAQARLKGLAIEVRVPSAGPRLLADPHRLRQVFANLLGNAVKFTERGNVVLSAWEEGDAVRIDVSDTGPGIPPEAQQRLFEEFEQGDATTVRRHGGSGLGLAIVKRLIDLHGGTIAVASTPGVGTTFSVRLPRAGRSAAPVLDEATAGDLADATAGRFDAADPAIPASAGG